MLQPHFSMERIPPWVTPDTPRGIGRASRGRRDYVQTVEVTFAVI